MAAAASFRVCPSWLGLLSRRKGDFVVVHHQRVQALLPRAAGPPSSGPRRIRWKEERGAHICQLRCCLAY